MENGVDVGGMGRAGPYCAYYTYMNIKAEEGTASGSVYGTMTTSATPYNGYHEAGVLTSIFS